MTDRWYLVTSWRNDGSAKRKIDITDELMKVFNGEIT